jgi:hypothetical protein
MEAGWCQADDRVKSLFYHEEHEDGIAGKLLLDVTIWHVDGRSRIEIAKTAAQPRNDNIRFDCVHAS